MRFPAGQWAKWDPKPALDAALARGNPEVFGEVASEAATGPFPDIGAGFAFSVLRDYPWRTLPEGFRSQALGEGESGTVMMEDWGDFDIGEAARFGFDFITEAEYAAREDLIPFFSGDDILASADNMIDRTFCSLRVWAAFKPAEVATWIATLKDPEMRQALTCLLTDPWGPG